MHTYIRTNNNGDTLYVVGHYLNGTWHPLRDFIDEHLATAYVSFLNGGAHPAQVSEVAS